MKPEWLTKALEYLGLKEIKGSKHEPKILEWFKLIKMDIKDDETAWCAAFVGGVLEECKIRSTRSAAARSYVTYGWDLKAPAVGCIVSFWRNDPKGAFGHVGFVVGKDQHNNLMVIGGNQADEVNIKPFSVDRVLSYNWPREFVPPHEIGFNNLPIVKSNGNVSVNEA